MATEAEPRIVFNDGDTYESQSLSDYHVWNVWTRANGRWTSSVDPRSGVFASDKDLEYHVTKPVPGTVVVQLDRRFVVLTRGLWNVLEGRLRADAIWMGEQ